MSHFRLAPTLGLILLFLVSHAQEVIVKEGDTLVSLAERYDTTPEAILKINGLSGHDLMPGALLQMSGQQLTYVVQRGDTLSGIAASAGATVSELVALNGLQGTDVFIGQTLYISGATAPLVVTVEPGESLWIIAERFGVDMAALSAANGLSVEASLNPGDRLSVPGHYANEADQGGGAEPTVTVASGESLSAIAERNGTTVEALMRANDLSSDVLNPGQTLTVPTDTATGLPGGAAGMVWPIVGPITSSFGPRYLFGQTYHYGLDVDGATGDPIVAAMPGTVTYSGWRTGYGNTVVVTSGNIEYYYAHASELLVEVGSSVRAGQLLARIGATGTATGSHLHFEVRIDGKAVDPLPFLERTAQLP